ncbi:hypothetical protein GCM10023350_25750 [Nocardioides endophyticus]|uniref:Bacterial Ig-like domain-containing protein n=1 Tax=Nocardioides endophyticus TaxID=1353775 RepID=A0ABP8YW60_9ACTN
MKKLISGLIAAFLLSAGFVAVSAETASAACKPSQYTPCPSSTTKAAGAKTVRQGQKPKTAITVRTAGNVKAKGTVLVTYKGPGVNKTIRVNYNGKPIKVTGPALKKPGKYTVTVVFKGDNTKDSKSSYKITVKKKRR